METVRVIYHHEADGRWAESPDVEGWSATGSSYADVVKLAEEGVPFALGHEAVVEHYVPAGEHVAAQLQVAFMGSKHPQGAGSHPLEGRHGVCFG